MRLDDIKSRAVAATPGPWEDDDSSPFWQLFGMTGDPYLHPKQLIKAPHESDLFMAYSPTAPDATFIAHSRDDIDWLVARVEELSAALRESDDDGYCRFCKRMVYVWDDNLDQQGGYWTDHERHADDCEVHAALRNLEADE